jgi:hypothetical protein
MLGYEQWARNGAPGHFSTIDQNASIRPHQLQDPMKSRPPSPCQREGRYIECGLVLQLKINPVMLWLGGVDALGAPHSLSALD